MNAAVMSAAVEIVTPRESAREAASRFARAKLAQGFKGYPLHRWREADGTVRYFVIRLKHPDTGEKWVRPMHLNDAGEYVLEKPPAPETGRLLYNLPALLAADPATPVFIVEGEGCADALIKRGIVEGEGCADALIKRGILATTSGSSSSADKADWSPLEGRQCIMWPDNDEAGMKYGAAAVAKLRSVPASVRAVSDEVIQALPEKGDVVDWLAEHPNATAADVLALPTVVSEPATANDATRALTRCLNDIKREALTWLWQGRIPLGKVSMLVGDPGLGKSMVTLGIAATVSRGGRWPVRGEGQAPAGSVVLVSAEDDPADTIRPRLEAAEADLTRIHVLDGIKDTNEEGEPIRRPWTLNDLTEIERFIVELGDCKLIVIDPVSAFLAGTDSHKNADIRALLAPLSDVVARHKVALVAVSHLNKSQGPAIYRTTGSLAFTAASRAVYCVTKDADDPARRILVPIKANLAPDATGCAYRIGTDETGTPRLEWEPDAFAVDANEVLSTVTGDPEERTERREAADWLRGLLSDGGMKASEVFKEASGSFSRRTLQRAKNDIGAKVERSGFGGGSRWYIPTIGTTDPQSQNLGTNGHLGANDSMSGFPGDCGGHFPHSRQACETGAHGANESKTMDVEGEL